MSRCRFVQPGLVRLSLSDGDYLDVKKELNAGEQQAIFTSLVKSMHMGERPELNPDKVGLTKILAYVHAWSFVDFSGQAVPFSEDALKSLDTSSYAEISKAIDVHDDAVEQERAERKKIRDGETTSVAPSPSVAVPV